MSLQRKRNLRLLICVVEAWAADGEPTFAASLAQANALADLCAVDRASARLAPLLQGTDLGAYQLGAQLLVDQGRIAEARTLIGQARNHHRDDPILKQLWSRTDGGQTQVDLTEPNEDDVDARVRQAERLLREGSPLKARRMLERIHADHPDHERLSDVLWANDGAFELKGVSLTDLARAHAPQLSLIDDEPEHTETGRPELVAALLDEDSNHGFPSLFKGMGVPESTQDTPEVTIASSAKDLADLTLPGEHTATGREDTQIMHVQRKDSDPAAVDTLIDRAPKDVIAPSGESEDEDVVLRMRSDAAAPDARPQDSDEGPVRLDPSRERVASGANASDEAADFITKPAPTVSQDDTPVQRSRSDAPTPKQEARKRFHSAPTLVIEDDEERSADDFLTSAFIWRSWLVVLVGLGAAVFLLGGVVILLQIVSVL